MNVSWKQQANEIDKLNTTDEGVQLSAGRRDQTNDVADLEAQFGSEILRACAEKDRDSAAVHLVEVNHVAKMMKLQNGAYSHSSTHLDAITA